MSKLTEALRSKKIYNDHDLLAAFAEKGKDVWCLYSPSESRSCQPARTRVCSPTHKTHSAADWADYGCKSFTGNRKESMPQAMAWATEKYGITEWASSPFNPGDKIPAIVRARAKEFAASE